MKRIWKLVLPWTWFKLAASTIALVVNAVQMSEYADEYGGPLANAEDTRAYQEMARAVAREGRWLRKHVGALDE